MIRVVIADDQQLIRDGFSQILRSQPDIQVAAEAADGRQLIDAVRRDPGIDIALVDIRMPVLDGLRATRELAAVPHAPAVIIVTTFDDDAYVLDAIAAGARGFLLKRASARDLIAAVGTVAAGEAIVSAEVTGAVLERVRATGRCARRRPGRAPRHKRPAQPAPRSSIDPTGRAGRPRSRRDLRR